MADIQGKVSNGIISLEKSGSEVIAMDAEGRVLYFMDGNDTWKRGIDNHYIRIGWDSDDRIIEQVTQDGVNEINVKASEFLKSVSGELEGDLGESVKYILSKEENWILADSGTFSRLYEGEFPIIPQDQRFSVYFQLTHGSTWNNGTFVRPSEDLKQRTEEEFVKHVETIVSQFGKGMTLRRGAFLGDAEALNLDQKVLLRAMDIIRESTSLPLYTFVDAFAVPKKKNMIHFQDMRRHGLTRVYVGIQSGSVSLLRYFERLKNVSEVLNLVNNLKNTGISVGLILLTGYGGRKYSGEHVNETASIISQMDLDEGDIIYISPMEEDADERYCRVEDEEEFGRMSAAEKNAQADKLEAKIREEFKGSNRMDLKTQISRYDIREGIY